MCFGNSAGGLLILIGGILLVPALQVRLAGVSGSVGTWANSQMSRFENRGLPGQAVLGALIGLVWVPCVGPTLGAASLLAAQGENLTQVIVVMLAFGIGAATPLVALGFASGAALARLRGRLRQLGNGGKYMLGASLFLLGLLIVTDVDKVMEAYLTEASPDWLVELTTRY